MQFQFYKVSAKSDTFCTFRGIEVLSALFDKTWKQDQQKQHSPIDIHQPKDDSSTENCMPCNGIRAIHSVSSINDHLAVTFHNGRQFVVFDAVPVQLRLSNLQQMKLQRFVLDEENYYFKYLLAMTINSCVIALVFINESSVHANENVNICKMNDQFTRCERSRKLQLICVDSNGGIIIWNWSRIQYVWQYSIRKILPSPLSSSENINQIKLHERPGILIFCSTIETPHSLMKIPINHQRNDEKIDDQHLQSFDILLNPFQNIIIDEQMYDLQSSESKPIIIKNSLHFLMIDYMMIDDDEQSSSEVSNMNHMHRYLLQHNLPSLENNHNICTRFIISQVRLDVQTDSDLEVNESHATFHDFNIMMDSLEEIEFWTEYLDNDDIDDDINDDDDDVRMRVFMVVEHLWTTKHGFVIELTVRQISDIIDHDLSHITINKRLLYYISPFMNQMIRIRFPMTVTENGCILRFVIGQHGTTKQLLMWDRINDALYVLDEHQITINQSLKSKFDLPFGHFNDYQQTVIWTFVCKLKNKRNEWKSEENDISVLFWDMNKYYKIWGYYDWICISIGNHVLFTHMTNIVLHRRHLYHRYLTHNQQSSDIKLHFPYPIYSSNLYCNQRIDDQQIMACAETYFPMDNNSIIHDFGIYSNNAIFKLQMPSLSEQVFHVNQMYSDKQRIIGGLNHLTRWGNTSIIDRSKYIIDFMIQQSNDEIKASQVRQALKIAPYPLVCTLLHKYPQFDNQLLREYHRSRNENEKYIFDYANVYGKNVMDALLMYLDHIRINEIPFQDNNNIDIDNDNDDIIMDENTIQILIERDIHILNGDISIADINDNDMKEKNITIKSRTLDMDEIRILITNESISDIELLETQLNLNGIRNHEQPFFTSDFPTDGKLLCQVLLLPSYLSNSTHSTPINLLASLCRYYDRICPMATLRLIRLLGYYQQTSSKRIAKLALNGFAHCKHGIWTKLSNDIIVFDEEIIDDQHFALFEERISCRVHLCEIAHMYYSLMIYLLQMPLTVKRLQIAIKKCTAITSHLTSVQLANVFQLLFKAWVEVRLFEYYNCSKETCIGDEWMHDILPLGFNAFHFLHQILSFIKERKTPKMNNSSLLKNESVSILVNLNNNDVPVKIIRILFSKFVHSL